MKNDVETGSGNVFADIGLLDAGQELLKARLILQVRRVILSRKLTQAAAANLLGTTQPQVSGLMRLRPTSLSVGRLIEFLTILGQDIEVKVTPASSNRSGRVVVNAAA